MTLQERINELFNKFNISLTTTEIPELEVALEAQAVLENGTIIYTDAASFEEGAEVYIVNEEGEKIPLPVGEYVLEDGGVLVIADGGKVAKAAGKGGDGAEGEGGGDGTGVGVGGNPPKAGKAPKAPPSKKKKKSAQEKLEDESTELQVDEQAVIDIVNRILDERFPAEEVVAEEEEEEVEEMAAQSPEDVAVQELTAQLTKQGEEITELKSQAAAEGVKRVKPTEPMTEPVDITNLSTEERVKALFNQFNK